MGKFQNYTTQISTELMHTLSYLTTAWSARARRPFLKQLNEDSNFKLHMYGVCMHKKEASEVPRTHLGACKISKLPETMPPDPPSTIYNMAPLHVLAQGTPILSAALITVAVKI